MDQQNTIKVQPEQIPEDCINVLARSLGMIAQEYFSDPDHRKEFETWQAAQKAGRG